MMMISRPADVLAIAPVFASAFSEHIRPDMNIYTDQVFNINTRLEMNIFFSLTRYSCVVRLGGWTGFVGSSVCWYFCKLCAA